MSATFMAKKSTTKGRALKQRPPVHIQHRAEKRPTETLEPRPEISSEVILKFIYSGGLLGNSPQPHVGHQLADRLRRSESSATIVRRIMADIEVLARRASHAKMRQGAVPRPTAPHPPDYNLHLLNEAPLRNMRVQWGRLHLRYAIWRQRHLAALRLAEVGTEVARRLELLADQQRQLMVSVAQIRSEWPVNLRLDKADVDGVRKLLGSKAAKKYLSSINLNAFSFTPCDTSPFSVSVEALNPARVAVERLVKYLRWLRDNPHAWLYFDTATRRGSRVAIVEPNRFLAKLKMLEDPITKSNVPQWWAVARLFFSEVWELNREAFRPFIKTGDEQFLDKDGPTYAPGRVRNPIINNHLKKAFLSLAIH